MSSLPRHALAIERTATQEAISQFQEMYDIAEELSDVDMLRRPEEWDKARTDRVKDGRDVTFYTLRYATEADV